MPTPRGRVEESLRFPSRRQVLGSQLCHRVRAGQTALLLGPWPPPGCTAPSLRHCLVLPRAGSSSLSDGRAAASAGFPEERLDLRTSEVCPGERDALKLHTCCAGITASDGRANLPLTESSHVGWESPRSPMGSEPRALLWSCGEGVSEWETDGAEKIRRRV